MVFRPRVNKLATTKWEWSRCFTESRNVFDLIISTLDLPKLYFILTQKAITCKNHSIKGISRSKELLDERWINEIDKKRGLQVVTYTYQILYQQRRRSDVILQLRLCATIRLKTYDLGRIAPKFVFISSRARILLSSNSV